MLGLVFLVIPCIAATVGTVNTLRKNKDFFEADKLSQADMITLIIMMCTNPEVVVLLPWKKNAYVLGKSAFPNRSVLAFSMSKGLEDVPQLFLQLTFALKYGGDAFTWVREWKCFVTKLTISSLVSLSPL